MTDFIDYARPMIEAEQLLKHCHDQCLKRNYQEAAETAKKVLEAVLRLESALLIMQNEL